MVMELISGGDLQQLLASSVPLSWTFLARIALDVALGMNYMHQLSPPIIHWYVYQCIFSA